MALGVTIANMDPETYRHVRAVFLKARSVPLSQRESFLDERLKTRPELRSEVESLLECDRSTEIPLLKSAFGENQLSTILDSKFLCEKDLEGMVREIGPYEYVRQLGVNGFSVVVLAQETSVLKRKVAIKVLGRNLAFSEILARFAFEQEALSRLSHPSIASVYSGGVTEDRQPYFVMEYVEGDDLRTHCRTRNLGTKERLELFVALCHAVQHAHGRGVIHRDIKSENVIVAEVEGRTLPKLIDFGISKGVDSSRDDREPTRVGQVLGTLSYMSPEQLVGDTSDIDSRTDVYSLGVVLYEILAERLPRDIRGKSTFEILERMRLDGPAMLGKVHSEFRGELEWIAATAMDIDPVRRYQSASELAADIDRWLRHEPVLAGKPGRVYSLKKLARRRPVATMISCTFLLLITTFFVVVSLWTAASREKANEKLKLVDLMLEGISKQLSVVPGTLKEREALLGLLIPSTSELVLLFPKDDGCVTTHARLLAEISRIEREKKSFDVAEERLLEAREILTERTSLSPSALSTLSLASVLLGDLKLREEQYQEAFSLYEESLEIDRKLARKFPAERQYLDDLCWGYGRLTDLHGKVGRLERAEDMRRKRFETIDELRRRFPEAPETIRSVAEMHLVLAEEIRKNDFDRVRFFEHVDRALAGTRQLFEKDQGNSNYRHGYVCALRVQSKGHREERNWSAVRSVQEEILLLARPVLEREPQNFWFVFPAFGAHEALRGICFQAGEFEEANSHAKEAISLGMACAEWKCWESRWVYEVVDAYLFAADIKSRMGEADRALEFYRQSLEAMRERTEQTEDPGLHARLSLLHSFYLPPVLRDPQAALGNAKRAEDFSDDPSREVERAMAYAYWVNDRVSEAIARIETALLLTPESDAFYPVLLSDLQVFQAEE